MSSSRVSPAKPSSFPLLMGLPDWQEARTRCYLSGGSLLTKPVMISWQISRPEVDTWLSPRGRTAQGVPNAGVDGPVWPGRHHAAPLSQTWGQPRAADRFVKDMNGVKPVAMANKTVQRLKIQNEIDPSWIASSTPPLHLVIDLCREQVLCKHCWFIYKCPTG